MNRLQRHILTIGFVLMMLCCAFPPWVHTYGREGMTPSLKPAGYASIIHPPEPHRGVYAGVGIDVTTLLVQIG